MVQSTKKALLLLLGLLLIVMIGCSSRTAEQPSASNTPAVSGNSQGNSSYFPLKEPIEVKGLMLDQGRNNQQRVDQELEKMTNIKFNWEFVPAGDMMTKADLIMASGDLPDIMLLLRPSFEKHQHSGAFIDFAEYLDQMPILKQHIDKFPDIANYSKTAEGKIYGINNFSRQGDLPFGYVYREDIYKKHNIKLPTTFDEMVDGFRQLKQIYPDSYPMTIRGGHTGLLLNFGYHTSDTIFFDIQIFGKIDEMNYKYGPATQNYVDSLSFMRMLYAEKLVDPEYAVANADKVKESLLNGKSFMSLEYIDIMTRLNEEGKAVTPDFRLTAELPPVTDTGLQARVYVVMPTSNWFYTVINKNSKYVNELVQYLDWLYSDEVTDLVNWGFEGETYTVKDGVKEFLPEVKTVRNPEGTIDLKELGVDGHSGFFPILDYYGAFYSANSSAEVLEALKRNLENAETIGLYPGPNIQLPAEMETERIRIMDSVNLRVQELASNYITGKIDLAALQNELKSIEAKGDYKPFLDYYNAEFDKIKDGYTINKTLE